MQQNISIKNLAKDDRPREKLLLKGRNSLSNAELLAILIGSGSRDKSAVQLCQEILKDSDNNLNNLARKSIQDLLKYKGIGEAKAISIVGALELGRRRKPNLQEDKPTISSSKIAFQLVKHLFEDLQHEEFYVILLNRANKAIRIELISKGGISGTIADGKLIFKAALEQSASGIILCHNHPSGSLKPSNADLKLTRKMTEFGKFIDLPIMDHLIITDSNYYSFADHNILT